LNSQTFDSRLAAIRSLRSFTNVVRFRPVEKIQPCYLPFLLALYDALNDDDAEIRTAAASAAAPLLGGRELVPPVAGDQLVALMGDAFGAEPEFVLRAAGRIVGHAYHAGDLGFAEAAPRNWTPAATLLEEAMKVDSALFVVEEQNLYVDALRETRRWVSVLAGRHSNSSSSGGQTPDVPEALADWSFAGLEALERMCEQPRLVDGPLGWTSKPRVFAVCARVMLAARCMLVNHEDANTSKALRAALERLAGVGTKARLHGALIAMCHEGFDRQL
jgi:hypothetical protein